MAAARQPVAGDEWFTPADAVDLGVDFEHDVRGVADWGRLSPSERLLDPWLRNGDVRFTSGGRLIAA